MLRPGLVPRARPEVCRAETQGSKFKTNSLHAFQEKDEALNLNEGCSRNVLKILEIEILEEDRGSLNLLDLIFE